MFGSSNTQHGGAVGSPSSEVNNFNQPTGGSPTSASRGANSQQSIAFGFSGSGFSDRNAVTSPSTGANNHAQATGTFGSPTTSGFGGTVFGSGRNGGNTVNSHSTGAFGSPTSGFGSGGNRAGANTTSTGNNDAQSGGASSAFAEEVCEFYQRHNPAKLADVPRLLEKYQGKESELMAKLEKKYGVSRSSISLGTSSRGTSAGPAFSFDTPHSPDSSSFGTPGSTGNDRNNTPGSAPSTTTNNAQQSSGGFNNGFRGFQAPVASAFPTAGSFGRPSTTASGFVTNSAQQNGFNPFSESASTISTGFRAVPSVSVNHTNSKFLRRGTPSSNKSTEKTLYTVDPALFVKDVPTHFLCCVCLQVPLEPLEHRRDNCSTILCKHCHQSMKTGPSAGGCFGPIEINKPCPQCRKGNMSEFQPMNRILRVNYFEPLEVRCPDANCKQVMKIASYAKHQEEECKGKEIKCPVEGCDFSCSRGLIAQHIFAEGLDHVEKLTKSHMCLLTKSEKDKKKKDTKQPGNGNNVTALDLAGNPPVLFGGGRPTSVSPSVASDDD